METRLASEGRELRIEYSFLRKVAGLPTKFRYKELEEATDNWKTLIGKGASALVFKGILKDGTTVAVKRIQHEEERGEKEFRSEIAAIASVQHTNLVRVLGYCMHNNLRFLVFEYIPNGSLANWIFSRPMAGRSSSCGVSSGGRRNVTVIDTGDTGNRSGKKFQYFPKIVMEKMKAGRVMEVVDQRLLDNGNIDEKEVKKMVHVALWCIQEKVRRRPSMVEVVKWLEGRVAVEEPPETQMIVVDLLNIDDDEDGDGGQDGNKKKKPRVVARIGSQLSGCLGNGNNNNSLSSKSFSYSMSIISPR
ncbi:hypothetical protein M8C21_018213 [Ambrosia artemisiifolia]|uniref:Protein kinase domain-containing protein n=1 Tax=Ambrosia artemisiifolia TaxID=4212 RepID=A0AAD5GB75_AMBAR|nr:hypothetical protein M8C21_018213 [Ambrosia artemisiifolia]